MDPTYRTLGLLRAETESLLRLLEEGELAESTQAVDVVRRRRLVEKVLGGGDGVAWAKGREEIRQWQVLQLQDALYPDAPEVGWISEPRPGVGEHGKRTVAALLAGGASDDGGGDDGGVGAAHDDAAWARDVIDLRIRQIVALVRQLDLAPDERESLVDQLRTHLQGDE
ncbi:MAG: hypothetical protein AAGC60_05615 [Acidobacteriota bacterium]